jgi:hypothetical protein
MAQRTLARDERGQILILTVLTMTALLGMAALAIDVGYFLDRRNSMGAAADAAAKAGAFEIAQNGAITQSTLEVFARREASLNGFTHGVNGVTVTINRPPLSPPFNNTRYVEAIVRQPVSTFFATVLGTSLVTIGNRAVAGVQAVPTCMVVLDPIASGAYTATGNAQINLPQCGVVINSTASSYGLVSTNGARLTATSISVGGAAPGFTMSGGGAVTAGGVLGAVNLATPPAPDPLAGLAAPTVGTCDHPSQMVYGYMGGNISPGTFCGGMQVNGGGIWNMMGGTYIINGGQLVVSNGATLRGTGVTIYNTGGAASISFVGGTTINLSAPTTGALAGILLFQDRTNTADFVVNNGAGITLTGALYFKAATLSFSGGSFSNLYTFMIANRLNFSNGATLTLNSDTSSLPGGSPLKTISMVE